MEEKIKAVLVEYSNLLFATEIRHDLIQFQATRKDVEGDLTLLVFPFVKLMRCSPVEAGEKIANFIIEKIPEIKKCAVINGFLNIVFSDDYWFNKLKEIHQNEHFGFSKKDSKPMVMVEYSSPNTNKPLHLGHIRNNLLGYSIAKILEANGRKVYKVNIVNDRGIHICKSMLAYQLFGNGETPETSNTKGDHLVGKYYVEFDKQFKIEVANLIEQGKTKEEAEKNAPLMLKVQEMLRQWEAGNEQVKKLWETMNSWVYQGFDITYKTLGVNFDKIYYESETYLIGKQKVEEGIAKNVFFKKEDNSVWIDLSKDGLDEKVVMRGDGTSLYITQDIGTSIKRHEEFGFNQMIYVVGNEQDYHFKVLFKILQKFGFDWAKGLYHCSYGMVELPEGKMKSREGTVVDADDLIDEMIKTAQQTTEELGKTDGLDETDKNELYNTIGLGALKYFILKVDPKKKMLFNPAESIDFHGNTGPFIQYTHARIKSILRKNGSFSNEVPEIDLHVKERDLLKLIYEFQQAITDAANNYSPAIIANYVYDLAKEFNQFYHECQILKEENEQIKLFRLQLIQLIAQIIKAAMDLLGAKVPEQM